MYIHNRKKFHLGLIGLALFAMILVLWMLPYGPYKTGLEWADHLFNQLAKSSSYYVPAATRKTEMFRGVSIDAVINPRWPVADKNLLEMLRINGISSTAAVGNGHIRLKADLNTLSTIAIQDADLLFMGHETAISEKYHMQGKEVVYYWWSAFDDLGRHYIGTGRGSEADLTKFITTRVLEPAYNFAAIEAKNISQNSFTIAIVLLLYVLYTLLYGFSIMFLFEGLGIRATPSSGKKEI